MKSLRMIYSGDLWRKAHFIGGGWRTVEKRTVPVEGRDLSMSYELRTSILVNG